MIAGPSGRVEEARSLFDRWKARQRLAASVEAGNRAVMAALGL